MKRHLAAAMLLAASTAPINAQTDPAVRVMLFGDASYLATERDVPEGFTLGQLVAHMNAGLADRLFVAAEATITPRSAGTVATLERLIVRYDFSDALKISGGRYHTPIAWWNTQYHHGVWLQTSIDRPRLVRFGTPLIPVHFLGLLAEGNVAVGRSALVYEAGIGNGRQPDLVGPGDTGESEAGLAFVGGLRLRPAALTGLQVGIHAYLDDVPAGATTVDERIVGGHVAWMSNPEVVVEYLHFTHRPEVAGADASTSDGLYAQAGWRPGAAPSLQPYVRYEIIEIGAGDPLFTGLGLAYNGIIGGLRWDVADYAALKGEVRSEERAGGDRTTSIVLNASFVIPDIIQ